MKNIILIVILSTVLMLSILYAEEQGAINPDATPIDQLATEETPVAEGSKKIDREVDKPFFDMPDVIISGVDKTEDTAIYKDEVSVTDQTVNPANVEIQREKVIAPYYLEYASLSLRQLPKKQQLMIGAILGTYQTTSLYTRFLLPTREYDLGLQVQHLITDGQLASSGRWAQSYEARMSMRNGLESNFNLSSRREQIPSSGNLAYTTGLSVEMSFPIGSGESASELNTRLEWLDQDSNGILRTHLGYQLPFQINNLPFLFNGTGVIANNNNWLADIELQSQYKLDEEKTLRIGANLWEYQGSTGIIARILPQLTCRWDLKDNQYLIAGIKPKHEMPYLQNVYLGQEWSQYNNNLLPELDEFNFFVNYFKPIFYGHQLNANVSVRSISNLIYYQDSDNNALYEPQNLPVASVLNGQIQLSRYWNSQLYNQFTADLNFWSQAVPNHPLLLLRDAMQYQLDHQTQLELEGIYSSSRSINTTGTATMGDYFLTNLNFSHNVRDDIIIKARINNLFNQQYYIYNQYLEPGLSVFLGTELILQ